MKIRIPRSAPSIAISFLALFVALGGASYAAVSVTGGQSPAQAANGSTTELISSGGERFFNETGTHNIGSNGHFTFNVSCKEENGENIVSFKVISNVKAALDGNKPMPADTRITIHEDSDALDSTPENPLAKHAFVQTASASSSTEIAEDGETADIFYNDGVNWDIGGADEHACFAGYNGIITRPAP